MTLRIIAGKYKGRLLKTPKTSSTRPTQGMLREALFNICQNEIEGARFLDLFAGSGAIGLEALSRGASQVTFVEHHRLAISCLKANISLLHAEEETLLLPVRAARALEILSKEGRPFDLVYIDPPYDASQGPMHPSLLPILSSNALVFVEERYSQKAPPQLPHLFLKSSRRFGIAVLHQFIHKNTK